MVAHPGYSHLEGSSLARSGEVYIHSFFLGQPWLPTAAAVQHLQTSLPWVRLTTWLSEWFIHVACASPHTGCRKVLLASQARTSAAVCGSSLYVNWTDKSALAPREAKRKPGRGAEQPIFIQALLLSPGQVQVNKVNALLMSKARVLLIPSALWGGEAILYTVKETSKRSRERRVCRGMKAPAGEEAEVSRCSLWARRSRILRVYRASVYPSVF